MTQDMVKFDYRPLCQGLTLKESPIDGIGLFATEDLKAGIYLGETHIWETRRREWIRTPLGGYINPVSYTHLTLPTNREV